MTAPTGRAYFSVAIATLCVGVVFGAADQLPSRIDDTGFWSLIARASEPDGQWQSDTVISNERMYQVVIPELVKSVPEGVCTSASVPSRI